jgi:TonB family protein
MIRATIVLLIAHVVIPRLRRASAAERHLLWTAAMATAAALPGLALIMPAWRPIWATSLIDVLPASFATLSMWALPRSPEIILRATHVEPTVWTPLNWIAAIWIVGSATMLLRLAAEVVKLRRLMSTSRDVTDPRALHLLRETASALGLRRTPYLLRSSHALVPLTWGLLRPRVLLPDEAGEWEEERLRAVLAHELAHIRRGDWLVHVSAQIACAAYWFHPLFWTAERALGRESEHAADDEVLGIGLDGSVYAAHLLDIVRAARTPMPPRRTVVAMARTSQLERRITALLDVAVNRGTRSMRAAMATGTLAIIVTLPLAAMTIQPSALYMDVVVQMLDLPPVAPAVDAQGPDPMHPVVRYVAPGDTTTGASIVPPTIAEYTTPALYSDRARQRGTEGIVSVALHVDERGRVANARVIKGLGDGLDQNALVAVRQWRFQPGTSNGGAVAMDAEVDIEFNLRTEAINELIANDMVTLVGPGVTPPRVARTSDMPSRITGARGTVLLDVVLLENGSPKILRILRSLSPEADESAVRHFEQWRFSPALRNGVPVKVRMNAEVRFHG